MTAGRVNAHIELTRPWGTITLEVDAAELVPDTADAGLVAEVLRLLADGIAPRLQPDP